MREQLIGYLLNALEPDEHQAVAAQVGRDPQLKRELELLERSLLPLAIDKGYCDPPTGLAERTCAFVVNQSTIVTPAPSSEMAPRQWKITDLVVAAGIFFAAVMLFFPALNQSRFAAQLIGCQNNLRQIGRAATEYSNLHGGYFPHVPLEGRLAAAGIYGPRLCENGFISNPQILVCPASNLATDLGSQFRVPTCQEVQRAQGQQLARLRQLMGGSYGYTFGYVAGGQYVPTRNRQRPTFAIMADAPNARMPSHSLNHGGAGQNVLFEDEHVQYLTTATAHGARDNIFLNDDGQPEPGLHMDDAVIAAPDVTLRLSPEVIRTFNAR